MIVAIDPGHNIGIAYVNREGLLLERFVVTLELLDTFEFPGESEIVVGDGTGSLHVQKRLRERNLSFVVCSEEGTSLKAKELYFDHHPPRGLMRFLPKGMRIPPRNVDDFAAYALALRYLNDTAEAKIRHRQHG
ncbi:MAG: hypothetical protein JSV66_05510 [Trueperaceae bacterium]|nr:MAG: hypothetical protein JSV66_05510 [Trueperaceae bacterium]